MEIEHKTVERMLMLEAEAKLTLSEIQAHSERIVPELLTEAEERELLLCGPCIFSYHGCDGKADTIITLKIGFPILGCEGQGKFACTEMPEHACVSTMYRGDMAGIGPAWCKFSDLARQQGYELGDIGREVYVHWVGFDSTENITELQIPLK